MVTTRDPDDDFFDGPPSPPRPLSRKRKRKRTETAVTARRPEQLKAAAVRQIVNYLAGTQARFFDDGYNRDIDIIIRSEYRVFVQQRSARDNGSCMIFTVHFHTDFSVRYINVASLKHLQGENCSLGGKELISWIQDAADRFLFSIQLMDSSYYRLKDGSKYCLWIFCILQNNLTWYQRRGFGFDDWKPWIQSSNNSFRNAPLFFFRMQNFHEHLAPLVARLYEQDTKYMFSFCNDDEREKFNSPAQFVDYVHDRWYTVAKLDEHIDSLRRQLTEFDEDTLITQLFTNARFTSMHSEVAYWVNSIFVHVIAVPDLNMVYRPALTGEKTVLSFHF